MAASRVGPRRIVLLDDVCVLCSMLLRVLFFLDQSRQLSFASQQSAAGRQLLDEYELPHDLRSVWFIDENTRQAYSESDACLRLCLLLVFPLPMLYALVLVPRRIRDAAYRLVARNRYRVFGTEQSPSACRFVPGLRARFLPGGLIDS